MSFERLFDDNGKVGDRVTGDHYGTTEGHLALRGGDGKNKPVVLVAKKKNNPVRQSRSKKHKAMVVGEIETEKLKRAEQKLRANEGRNERALRADKKGQKMGALHSVKI